MRRSSVVILLVSSLGRNPACGEPPEQQFCLWGQPPTPRGCLHKSGQQGSPQLPGFAYKHQTSWIPPNSQDLLTNIRLVRIPSNSKDLLTNIRLVRIPPNSQDLLTHIRLVRIPSNSKDLLTKIRLVRIPSNSKDLLTKIRKPVRIPP